MTNATVTIPRQADYSVTAAASELASTAKSRAQTGALKSWKVNMSSQLALSWLSSSSVQVAHWQTR